MKSSLMAVLCGLGLREGDVINEVGSLAEVGQKDPQIMECLTVQIKVNTVFKTEGIVGMLSEGLTHLELGCAYENTEALGDG